MPSLTLVRGLPGSGKTTLAEHLKRSCGFDHFEADHYFECSCGYLYQPEKIKDAHDACFSKTKSAVMRVHNVVVANTFMKKWEIDRYLKLPSKVTIRVARGNYQNQHGVSEETLERMRRDWQP